MKKNFRLIIFFATIILYSRVSATEPREDWVLYARNTIKNHIKKVLSTPLAKREDYIIKLDPAEIIYDAEANTIKYFRIFSGTIQTTNSKLKIESEDQKTIEDSLIAKNNASNRSNLFVVLIDGFAINVVRSVSIEDANFILKDIVTATNIQKNKDIKALNRCYKNLGLTKVLNEMFSEVLQEGGDFVMFKMGENNLSVDANFPVHEKDLLIKIFGRGKIIGLKYTSSFTSEVPLKAYATRHAEARDV